MKLCFSHALNSSIPHIRWNGKGFRTAIGSFSRQMPSSFHNHMPKSSLGLHKALIGDTFYCITGHLTSSTKKWNKSISIWPTRTSKPLFKYPLTQDLKSGIFEWVVEWMDNLGKAWMLSSNQPWHNYFSLSISLTNIQNFQQSLHMCAQLQETPTKLLQKLHE